MLPFQSPVKNTRRYPPYLDGVMMNMNEEPTLRSETQDCRLETGVMEQVIPTTVLCTQRVCCVFPIAVVVRQ